MSKFPFLLFAFFPICIVCDINQFKFNAILPLLFFSFIGLPVHSSLFLNDYIFFLSRVDTRNSTFLQHSIGAYSCLDRWEKKVNSMKESDPAVNKDMFFSSPSKLCL